MAATPMWRVPGFGPSLKSNAMRVPSGDHVGRHTSNSPFVICTGGATADADIQVIPAGRDR